MFSTEDMARWKQRFIEYCDGKHEKLPGMLIMRDISIAKAGKKISGEADVTKIQDF